MMPATPRALIVDDEDAILRITQTVLEREGFEVLTATGGVEALELLDREGDSLQLVILDLVMPDLSGAKVFQKLRQRWAMPVLFHSGFRGTEGGAEVEGLEGTGFLQKPWTLAQLRDAVRELVPGPS